MEDEEFVREVLVLFKRIKTMEILRLLVWAKFDNFAERFQEKSYALHRWGVQAQKK